MVHRTVYWVCSHVAEKTAAPARYLSPSPGGGVGLCQRCLLRTEGIPLEELVRISTKDAIDLGLFVAPSFADKHTTIQ